MSFESGIGQIDCLSKSINPFMHFFRDEAPVAAVESIRSLSMLASPACVSLPLASTLTSPAVCASISTMASSAACSSLRYTSTLALLPACTSLSPTLGSSVVCSTLQDASILASPAVRGSFRNWLTQNTLVSPLFHEKAQEVLTIATTVIKDTIKQNESLKWNDLRNLKQKFRGISSFEESGAMKLFGKIQIPEWTSCLGEISARFGKICSRKTRKGRAEGFKALSKKILISFFESWGVAGLELATAILSSISAKRRVVKIQDSKLGAIRRIYEATVEGQLHFEPRINPSCSARFQFQLGLVASDATLSVLSFQFELVNELHYYETKRNFRYSQYYSKAA